jgi:alpha-tubulin suppressor-like RCC1 family protein
VAHLPTPITKVVCSNGYSMALTKAGELFTWGKNSQGQCGIGNSSSSVSQPMQVHFQEAVLDIAASRYSGISVCTTKNQVYFWGTCDGSKFEPVCSPRVSPFETIHQVFASYSPEMMHEALSPATVNKKDLNLMQQSCHQTLAETLLSVFVTQVKKNIIL